MDIYIFYLNDDQYYLSFNDTLDNEKSEWLKDKKVLSIYRTTVKHSYNIFNSMISMMLGYGFNNVRSTILPMGLEAENIKAMVETMKGLCTDKKMENDMMIELWNICEFLSTRSYL